MLSPSSGGPDRAFGRLSVEERGRTHSHYRNRSRDPVYTHKGLPSVRRFDADFPHHLGSHARRGGAVRLAVVRVRALAQQHARTYGRGRAAGLRARVRAPRARARAGRTRPRSRLLLLRPRAPDGSRRRGCAVGALDGLDRVGAAAGRHWLGLGRSGPTQGAARVPLAPTAANAGGVGRSVDRVNNSVARAPPRSAGRSLAPDRSAGRFSTPRGLWRRGFGPDVPGRGAQLAESTAGAESRGEGQEVRS